MCFSSDAASFNTFTLGVTEGSSGPPSGSKVGSTEDKSKKHFEDSDEGEWGNIDLGISDMKRMSGAGIYDSPEATYTSTPNPKN